MAAGIQPNQFNRAMPFYPLVMHYVVFLHALKVFPARHTYQGLRTKAGHGPPADDFAGWFPSVALTTSEQAREAAQIRKLLGPLELRCKAQSELIISEIDDVSSELFNNHPYLFPVALYAAGQLLITAYETTKPFHDRGPLWQFLRHCRNAAAHGGRFHFSPGEPKYSAEWRNLKIVRSMQGAPLIGSYHGVPGLLDPGDPSLLLWDIELANPNMTPDLGIFGL